MRDNSIRSGNFMSELVLFLHDQGVDDDLDTADFILAQYLIDCLKNLYNTMDRRECDHDANKYLEEA